MWIRIQEAHEYGSNTDSDPQHWFLQYTDDQKIDVYSESGVCSAVKKSVTQHSYIRYGTSFKYHSSLFITSSHYILTIRDLNNSKKSTSQLFVPD